jgi:hypothetical protein
MDFELFESLSEEEARSLLAGFLETGKRRIELTEPQLRRDGVSVDFTVGSIHPVFEWILERLPIVSEEVDESLPAWIKASDSYKGGFFSFDDSSKDLVLAAAYYMGEAFNRYSERLVWSIGSDKSLVVNMPVITGFLRNKEMALIMVAENLFTRVLADGAPRSDFQRAVDTWMGFVPR